eukprot:15221995-Alexandrium_andersonii.AAC.1
MPCLGSTEEIGLVEDELLVVLSSSCSHRGPPPSPPVVCCPLHRSEVPTILRRERFRGGNRLGRAGGGGACPVSQLG